MLHCQPAGGKRQDKNLVGEKKIKCRAIVMIQKVLKENHYDGGKLGRIKEDKDVKKGLSERYDIFKVS